MNAFLKLLASSSVGSTLKTFAAVVLGAAYTDWKTGGAISMTEWKTWVFAGVISVAPTVINALNPADKRYGLGKAK